MTKKKRALPILHPNVSLLDTHCHLDMDSYGNDLSHVIMKASKHGVRRIITIGIDIESSRKAVRIASQFPMVHATIGIHPHDTGSMTNLDLDALSALAEEHNQVIVGYGEIGLDYVKNYAPRKTQLRAFSEQLDLAKQLHLPVIIHDREAHEDTITLLKEKGPFPHGGIMHCFSGNMKYAEQVLHLGFHISIPGIVTFKNAQDLKEVAANIPIDRLLLETDGPFLAPVPYRGKRNEPLFLLYTAEEVSRLRGITLDELATATTNNGLNLFSIPKNESE